MAGSGSKGGCTVNLNNMKNKAPAEMYELKKIKRKKIEKKRNKGEKNQKKEKKKQKNEKKGVPTFSNRGLRCSWRPTVGYIFLQTVQQVVLFLS